MDLPRVLIIGQPFNQHTGGGVTISNLFKGWEKNKLASVCAIKLSVGKIDFSICDNYYQMGYDEVTWRFPFRLLQRKYKSGILTPDDGNLKNITRSKPSKIRGWLVDNYFLPFLDFSGFIHGIYETHPSPEFYNWLDDFKPDVIYAQAQDYESLVFCRLVHDYLKKPLIFHTMDDWISELRERPLFNKTWFKKIDSELRLVISQSGTLLSISKSMAKEYRKRYGKEFLTFHNPIDVDFWQKESKTDYELNENPIILYAGRIGIGINHSLELIGQAIEIVNSELNINLRLVLQTQNKPKWIHNYTCVEHRELVPYQELPKVFSKADFLILPYDFSKKSIKYIKYSMPTKATEYLASGTPVIIFAPEETAVVQYLRDLDCAQILTTPHVHSLAKSIVELIQNENLRKRIGKKARSFAKEEHSSVIVRSRFREMIISTAKKTVNAPVIDYSSGI